MTATGAISAVLRCVENMPASSTTIAIPYRILRRRVGEPMIPTMAIGIAMASMPTASRP